MQRIAVYGDSITWGVGVRDWRLTYPARLLQLLNATGTSYDMHVMATPGRSVDSYARWAEVERTRLDPDFVIYQWYINDLEIGTERPELVRSWRQWSGHPWLAAHSYLYYFLDYRFDQLLPPASHFYTDYVTRTFVDGTSAWATFRDAFHRWAVYSTAAGGRALVFLYPQVPFRGVSPLAGINARMRALTGRTEMHYPAAMCPGETGETVSSDVIDGRVRRSVGEAGRLVHCPGVPMLPGHYRITARIRLDRPISSPSSAVATLTVSVNGAPVGSRSIDAASLAEPGSWCEVPIDFDVRNALADVQWGIEVGPAIFLSVESMTVPVGYERLDVIDLSDRLNGFDTHASLFDAHPNARAHAVIADALAEWIRADPRH